MEESLTGLELAKYSRLVHCIARKFSLRKGVEIEDLVQEGYIGLLKAKEKFDPERGVKFSTYAYKWIWKYAKDASVKKKGPEEVPLEERLLASSPKQCPACAQVVRECFSSLREQDQILLGKRVIFGKNLKEIGEEQGISQERVRQVEKRIKENLKRKLLKKLGGPL